MAKDEAATGETRRVGRLTPHTVVRVILEKHFNYLDKAFLSKIADEIHRAHSDAVLTGRGSEMNSGQG